MKDRSDAWEVSCLGCGEYWSLNYDECGCICEDDPGDDGRWVLIDDAGVPL